LVIYCVVPAAGESTRFPWNKLLYNYCDKPVIVQTISNILESGVFKKVVVVLGYQHELVADALRDFRSHVDITVNSHYKQGMSTSIKLGVEYIARNYGDARIIGVNPGDVAWIHPGIYTSVVVRFSEQLGRFRVAVAAYRGIRGHPILFSSEILSELLSISEEKMGLKEITSKYRDQTLIVETGYPGVILDLDTVLDILRVKQLVNK
jgi:molybdenum cofactor cytidylyltransferase